MVGESRTLSMDFRVNFQYPVEFTYKLFSIQNHTLKNILKNKNSSRTKFIVVADENVLRHHPSLASQIIQYAGQYQNELEYCGDIISVQGGEASKNQHDYIEIILNAINEYHIDRQSYVLAIGGGAVIDMVGYSAAIAHRGVRLIRIPTTVLAQNDAAVGVKNSINAYGKKNFIGTFAPPYAVLNDFNFLHTLDQRDWISGISEAVKVALLKDEQFFNYIHDHAGELAGRDSESMEHVIYRCAELHLNHIAHNGDPFEMGSSRPLDFGHWSAHKLEQLTDYELRHGEAVATGIALDCIYANLLGMLDDESVHRIINTFQNLGFTLFTPALDALIDDGERAVFAGLREFQEHLGGKLHIMLLESIGIGVEVHEIDLAVMTQAIDYLRKISVKITT